MTRRCVNGLKCIISVSNEIRLNETDSLVHSLKTQTDEYSSLVSKSREEMANLDELQTTAKSAVARE